MVAQNVVSEYSAAHNFSAAGIEAPDEEASEDDHEFTAAPADNDDDSAEANPEADALPGGSEEELARTESQEPGRMWAQNKSRTTERIEPADRLATEVPGGIRNSATSPDSQFSEAKPAADERQLNPVILQGQFAVARVANFRGKPVGIIQVEAEETLGHYAEWLGVSAQKIRRLNGFRYGQPLHLSQQIKIPLDRVTKEDFEEKRFEFHQELAEDFFATYRVEKVLTYSVKRGDNIWNISHQEFEVPLWLIKSYNADVDFSALIPSQKLLIPVVEKNV